MNEDAATELAGLLAQIEAELGAVQAMLCRLGINMHARTDLTVYQSHAVRQAYGNAQAAVGEAIGAVVFFHREAGRYDPRPSTQSGGGGK